MTPRRGCQHRKTQDKGMSVAFVASLRAGSRDASSYALEEMQQQIAFERLMHARCRVMGIGKNRQMLFWAEAA